jgi:SAM-dependent methyltransferase
MAGSSEEFYQQWSDKTEEQIRYDLESCERKAEMVALALRQAPGVSLRKILDFGCGYGKIVALLSERFALEKGYGFDFSQAAISYAQSHFASGQVSYHRLATLDISREMDGVRAAVGGSVDCVLLVDVLEHVPDCQAMMRELAPITKYFFVKLPIEENLLNNYLLNKEYPSSRHSNGHLREFNVNSVYYFVRRLGLTPVVEGTYIYDIRDSFPPFEKKPSFKSYLKWQLLKGLVRVSARLLPKRLHLRCIGMGSYYCLATFDEAHVLNG